MQKFRLLFSIIPIILLLGAMLLLLLTILGGTRQASPLDQFYFLQAQVSADGLTSPGNYLRWTSWNICGTESGRNVNCGKIEAAHPFAPARQLTNAQPSLPESITSHDSQSYITSRTFFAFLLMALFFTFIALLASLIGCLGRLGGVIGLLTAFTAFLIDGIASALMTVVYIRGRDRFRAGGIPADIGVKLFAFMWTATFICLLCSILYIIAACIPSDNTRSRRRARSYQEKPLVTDSESAYVPVEADRTSYVAPVVAHDRSSYERQPVSTSGATAGPIDGLNNGHGHTSASTGATYLR